MLPALAAAQPDRVYKSLAEVDDPSQVYVLRLRGKRLKSVPPQVYGMPNLRELDLRGNRIRTLSDSIALLTHLERLELSRNPLDSLPAAMASMTELKELVLIEAPTHHEAARAAVITPAGNIPLGEVAVTEGRVRLALSPGQAVALRAASPEA